MAVYQGSLTVKRRPKDGGPGDPGEDGYSVSLSKSEHTFNYDKNGNLKGILSDGAISVEVLNGSNPHICDSTAVSPPTLDGTYRVTGITISPSTTLSYNVDRLNNVFRLIPTMIAAEEVMVSLTIVARAKGINTTFTRQLKYQKHHDGTQGSPGDSVVHIYKQYPTKPTTPSSGVINPTGWSRNPDYILSIVSQTNWTVNGKWHQSEELTATGNSSTSRITFTTYKDAQTITLELWADGHATYDYVYAGNLDTAISILNYSNRVRGGRIIITYDVPTAGNHYIDIFWKKGISTIVGSNRGYYAIISNVKVWRSATNVIGGVAQAWSEPQQFFIDSALEERIYCLSKTTTAPAISDSDAHINDYIPLPCSLSSYRGDFTTYRAYSIGQVVRYQLQYYKVVKAVTSASTRYPTDEEYFEKIQGWTDNPVGANKDYPFEFVAIRKKQADGLWGQFVSSVWTKWVTDGYDGMPGQVPIQKEWVVGDTHRFNDEIKDYIYVRGASGNTSYWYTRTNKGDVVAGAAPVGGANKEGYTRVDWLKTLAVNVLLAEEANLANFIFKEEKLISVRGTVNGVETNYSGQANFKPYIILDGKSGKIYAEEAEIRGKITGTSGSFGGWAIENGTLVSSNGRIRIDAKFNRIDLLDSNGNVKTSIKPTDISSSVSSYFGSGGILSGSLSAIKLSNSSTSTVSTSSVSVDASGGKSFIVRIPAFTLTAIAQYNGSAGGSSYTDVKVFLTNGSVEDQIGGIVYATSFGTVEQESISFEESLKIISSSGSWRLKVVKTSYTFPTGQSHSASWSFASSATSFTIEEIVERSEIGSNGMMIATSASNYNFMVGGVLELRRGNFGFRISASGFQKMTNGSTWSAASNNIE